MRAAISINLIYHILTAVMNGNILRFGNKVHQSMYVTMLPVLMISECGFADSPLYQRILRRVRHKCV